MLSFDNQRSVQVRVDPTALTLRRGFAVHRLELQVELRSRGLDDGTVRELQADLSTSPPPLSPTCHPSAENRPSPT
jgi:hypothetical protein